MMGARTTARALAGRLVDVVLVDGSSMEVVVGLVAPPPADPVEHAARANGTVMRAASLRAQRCPTRRFWQGSIGRGLHFRPGGNAGAHRHVGA